MRWDEMRRVCSGRPCAHLDLALHHVEPLAGAIKGVDWRRTLDDLKASVCGLYAAHERLNGGEDGRQPQETEDDLRGRGWGMHM
jgi:hypothetical protein